FLATTAAYPGYPRVLEITGTEGTAAVEHDRVARWDVQPREGVEPPAFPAATAANASGRTAVVADASPHRRVLEDFVTALRERRASDAASTSLCRHAPPRRAQGARHRPRRRHPPAIAVPAGSEGLRGPPAHQRRAAAARPDTRAACDGRRVRGGHHPGG